MDFQKNKKTIKKIFNKMLLILLNILLIIQFIGFPPRQAQAATRDWAFTIANNYTYDNTKIEVSSGQIQVKATGTPDWDDNNWTYRQAITIDNSTSTLSNYQVKVELTPSNFDYSHASSALADLRFTDSSGTTDIPYWIENVSTTSTSPVWVKAPSIPGDSASTIYMYYGNSSASSESNVTTTFIGEIDELAASWHFDEGGLSETNYFASDGALECTTHDLHQQTGQYYNNKTYVGYIGPAGGTHIMYYDHINEEWSDSTKIADYSTPGGFVSDDHGAPSLLIDDSGYIHVFYGSHADELRYKKSTNPGDISSWTTMSDVTTYCTYPQAFQVSDGTIYVFYRGQEDGRYAHAADWSYRTSTDGGNTWSDETAVIDGDNVARNGWYVNFIKGTNDIIHAAFIFDDIDGSGTYKLYNAYYIYMETDGTWKNANGTNLTLPLSKSDADLYARIYDSGANHTHLARAGADEENNPYVLFTSGGSFGTTIFSHKFAKWNGADWEVKDIGSNSTNLYDSFAFNVISSTEMEVYLTTGTPMDLPATGTYDDIGGTVEKWVSHDGGEAWAKEETIISKADISGEQIIRNYHSDAKVAFSQYGTMDWYNNKVYLYGDSGFVKNTLPVAQDSSGMGYDGNLCSYGTCHQPGPTWTTNNCNYGTCLDFDGENDHVYIENEILRNDLASGSPYSIAGWFYPRGENNDSGDNPEQVLINLRGRGGWSTYVSWQEDDEPNWPHSTTFRPYNSTDGYGLVASSYNSNPEGSWYHFVATQGDGIARLYINGQEVTASENPSPISHSGPASVTGNAKIQSQIGKDWLTEAEDSGWDKMWFNGLMDELHIFEKVLTSEEVADLYNNYGYSTTNYPDKLLIRKYTAPEPSTTIGSEASLYPSDNPTIQPSAANSLSSLSLSGFVETATKDGGEIKYILSNNDGSTWEYYDGSDWVTSDGTYNQANTATEINVNIATFPAGSRNFLFKAFLHSDGSQLVQLDNIEVTYRSSDGYSTRREIIPPEEEEEEVPLVRDKTIKLIKAPDSPAVYLIREGQKQLIPHSSVFHSWGYSFEDVQTVEISELTTYQDAGSLVFRDGTLVRSNLPEKTAVYIAENNKLRPVQSAQIFENLEYDWSQIKWLPDGLIETYEKGDLIDDSTTFHPDGTLIKYLDSSSVYLIENSRKRPIKSVEVFKSLGFEWEKILILPKTFSYETGKMVE